MFQYLSRGTTALAALAALGLSGCGGGGGGSSDGGNSGTSIEDPIIPLVGPTGTYSMTPKEANDAFGGAPPPVLPDAVVGGQNQYLRLEVPFRVVPTSIATPNPIAAPFSQLNGNLLFTDEAGNHVPGILIVNGYDIFGQRRDDDAGFPADPAASGQDLNVGQGVILYVADDGDGDLSSLAAFGGGLGDSDSQASTTDISQIRVTVASINDTVINGFYTVTVGDPLTGDMVAPVLLSIERDMPVASDPLNPAMADPSTRFILRFSEPCVPSAVGESVALRVSGAPYRANIPQQPFPGRPVPPPLPSFHLTSPLIQGAGQLYIPCDVNPLNSNNLATYVVTPLIDLPPVAPVTAVAVDAAQNIDPVSTLPVGPMDLSGNFSAGRTTNFTTGPGRSIVNAPVSPQVMYWIPAQGRGIGAVDLYGFGFNTNTPGVHANDRTKAAIVPKVGTFGQPLFDTQFARAVAGYPPGGSSINNRYSWPMGGLNPPLGLGGFPYGPGQPDWVDPNVNNLGNPGTPFPGVNEMSSGFETLVRDANGSPILTGTGSLVVGRLHDASVGEFLDVTLRDTQAFANSDSFHVSLYWGTSIRSNSIGEPPIPNPPPLRYWLGVTPTDILIDQESGAARIIEGEEIWAGDKRLLNGGLSRNSFQWLVPNPSDPFGPDQLPPGMNFGQGVGPVPQSGTISRVYSARQQIGNYLYVTDVENRQVHALNSNSFRVIDSIPLPDPRGLAIAPNARFLFVTNQGDDTVSVIGADPELPDFHTEIARVEVGRGPDAVAVQPDMEDVHVANFLGDSISILELGTLTVRKELDALIAAPVDVVLSPRENAFGWFSGLYFGYYSNFSSNSVVVYESGPDGPNATGCNQILGSLPTEDNHLSGVDFFEPRGMTYCAYPNDSGLLSSGVYVAHRDENGRGVISLIQFSHQAIIGPLQCRPPPGGVVITPPGFLDREFLTVGRWGEGDTNRLLGNIPTSIALLDYNREQLMSRPTPGVNNADRGFIPTNAIVTGGNYRTYYRGVSPPDVRAPYLPTVEPDRMYVSFADSDLIQVLDPLDAGRTLGTVERTGVSVNKLITYFQQ